MFFWAQEVQRYDKDGWSYRDQVIEWVFGGMKCPAASPVIAGASGIVNRGCHNPPNCGTGALLKERERAEAFVKVLKLSCEMLGSRMRVLRAMWKVMGRELDEFDCPSQIPPPSPTGQPTPVGPPTSSGSTVRCGSSWGNANGKCGTACPDLSDASCPSGEACYSDLDAAPCPSGEACYADLDAAPCSGPTA
eukprot:364520-Chlamydomonas_euryale.AAC.5